jgi:hypothetical protein
LDWRLDSNRAARLDWTLRSPSALPGVPSSLPVSLSAVCALAPLAHPERGTGSTGSHSAKLQKVERGALPVPSASGPVHFGRESAKDSTNRLIPHGCLARAGWLKSPTLASRVLPRERFLPPDAKSSSAELSAPATHSSRRVSAPTCPPPVAPRRHSHRATLPSAGRLRLACGHPRQGNADAPESKLDG